VVGGVTGAVGGALSKIPLVGGAAGGLVSGVGGAAGGLVSGVGSAAGGLVSGAGGLVGGAISGATGAIGAAAGKLASVKKGMPKPNIPKPPSIPRIKTVKIKRPSNKKGAETLLSLQKSKLDAAKLSSQITANIDTNKLNSYSGLT